MKKRFIAFALIPKPLGDQSRWFCVWNEQDAHYSFVTAEESDRTVLRTGIEHAVQQELGLQPHDFLVSNMAQLNLELAVVLPGESSQSHLVVAFYMVNPYGKASRSKIDGLLQGAWLTGQELLSGASTDGRRIDPVLQLLLRKSEVVQAW